MFYIFSPSASSAGQVLLLYNAQYAAIYYWLNIRLGARIGVSGYVLGFSFSAILLCADVGHQNRCHLQSLDPRLRSKTKL